MAFTNEREERFKLGLVERMWPAGTRTIDRRHASAASRIMV
jgi:hypothetical protein